MLHPETNKAIAEVEKLSGRKVQVQEDPSLPTLAVVQTARGGAPFHLVRYRPSGVTTNYLIVYQLGFLIRLFSCPQESRWDVVASAGEKGKGIEGLGLAELPLQFAGSMVDQLITQLRTYSVGLRVDEWILREFSKLKSEQEESVRAQLAENEQALKPELREKFPKGLVDANSAMNAAYARLWSEKLAEPRYFVPFKSLGYGDIAGDLLGALKEIPDEPKEDRRLIEAWAGILGLSDYFHFQPHQLDE